MSVLQNCEPLPCLRYGLSRLSPLLSGVLAVEEGKVKVVVTPEGLTLPSDAYGIRVEPLRYLLFASLLSRRVWLVIAQYLLQL